MWVANLSQILYQLKNETSTLQDSNSQTFQRYDLRLRRQKH